MQQIEAKIAAVYAETLLELAEEKNSVEAVDLQLKECASLLQKDQRVWKFLNSPVISSQNKAKALETALTGRLKNENGKDKDQEGDKAERLIIHFLSLTAKRGRLEGLPLMQILFHKQANHALSRQDVRITSARELPQEEEKELYTALEKYLGKKIIVEKRIRPDLIGGLLIHTEDLLIDSTIQTRLHQMRDGFLKQNTIGERFYQNNEN